METNKLTLIACSGSILAATLFGSPSHGMPVQSVKGGERQIASLAVRQGHSTNIRQSDRNEQSLLSASYQRRLQLAAFSKFGCGCPNCCVLNDTTIGGETAISSGVKYAVIGQTTASINTTEAPASYRSQDRSVAVATTSDRSK
jgi:phage FluMu protein Com